MAVTYSYFKSRFWGFKLNVNLFREEAAPRRLGILYFKSKFWGFKLRASPFNPDDAPWRLPTFILNQGFGDLNYVPALPNDKWNIRILTLEIWRFKIPRPPVPVDQLGQSSEF